MIKKNKIAYWVLLLAAIVLLAEAVPGVGDVRAHYNNTIYWNTILTQTEQKITSDCLMVGGQTVLLGEVTEESWVTIELESDVPISGVLTYEFINPEQEYFLQAALLNEQVDLSRGSTSAYLILAPTEAVEELEQSLDVDILVTFLAEDGQILYGTFRATLPKAIKEESKEENNDTYSVDNDTTSMSDILPGEEGTDDNIYSVDDDTVISPGITPDDETEEDTSSSDDVYSNEEDTEVIPDITPDDEMKEEEDTSSGDDVYSNEEDTDVTPDITPDEETEEEEDTSSGDDVYSNEEDTDVTPDITPDDETEEEEDASSSDDVYSNEEDTDVIPDITPDDETEEEDDTSSNDDVYSVSDDTVIISGITTGDANDDGGTSSYDVYSIEDDTSFIRMVLSRITMSLSTGSSPDETVYSVDDDTEIIPGITTGEGNTSSDDDVYSNDEDTDVIPDITPDEETEEEEDTSSSDDVYSNEEDTEVIPGITPDDGAEEEEDTSSSDDVYSNEEDTEVIPGIAEDDETKEEGENTSSADDVYSVDDDTERTSGITTGDGATSEGGESTVEEEEPPVIGEVYINTLSSFSMNGRLPILVEVPQGSTRLVLNCAEGKLPAYTRYSTDGGTTWFMLYYGGSIDVNLFGEEELYLLLDLSYTNQQDSLTFTASVYTEEGMFVGEQTVEPYVAPQFFGTGTNCADVVLGNESTLYFPLDFGGEGYSKTYELEVLTVGENAAELSYVTVDIGLIDVDIADNVLILTNRNANLRAGTYRLTVEYYFSGICFARSEYTFFVNYSGTI